MTSAEIQLIDCPKKYKFLMDGLRGGFSVITQRYVEGSDDLEDEEDNIKLLYIDENNLYGAGGPLFSSCHVKPSL